jgi:hypothetical protein
MVPRDAPRGRCFQDLVQPLFVRHHFPQRSLFAGANLRQWLRKRKSTLVGMAVTGFRPFNMDSILPLL